MKYIIFLFLLNFASITAQKNASFQQEPSIEDLTRLLTQNIANDSLKVVAIYDWITVNIQYDRYFRRRIEGDTTLTQEPDYVVKSKKAVCIGYAKLVTEMCHLANISAVIIEGFAKGDGQNVDTDEHAWNAVKINKNWYLIDATWGSSGSFYAKKYFLSPPSVFVETHLPHDPIWQLSDQVIGFECFMNGKNCGSDKKRIFQYQDSLAVWATLDSFSQSYNEATRILNYNPKDIRAMRQLAEYYGKTAMAFFSRYAQIRQEVKDKIRQPDNQQSVLQLLESASENLLKAKEQYQRILPFAKKNRYTDAHMNIDLIEENLANIEHEKAFVLKYFR